MRLLLDTHVLLWWMADEPISDEAMSAITDAGNDVFVSAVSAWEISIKKALGKLEAPDDLIEQIEANAFSPLDVTVRHGLTAGGLPRHHDDPFDRMLLAQAVLGQLVLVTRDARFDDYDVTLLGA
jgi:PIN domain nuclease of toxin-antitoxin system